MISFFRKLRKKYLNGQDFGKYILYAIGEIVLITLGVLIAVNINQRVIDKKNQKLRCQYLDELQYTFEFDIKDVEASLDLIKERNPKINSLIQAIENDTWSELDSIEDKLNTVKQFMFFGQRTKTKMDELKYSSIDLIGDRNLKNNLLLYQDEQIGGLLNIEGRYNAVDTEIRKFYSNNLFGGQMNINKLKESKMFYSIIRQKFGENDRMKRNYESIHEKQLEIKSQIESVLRKHCND